MPPAFSRGCLVCGHDVQALRRLHHTAVVVAVDCRARLERAAHAPHRPNGSLNAPAKTLKLGARAEERCSLTRARPVAHKRLHTGWGALLAARYVRRADVINRGW